MRFGDIIREARERRGLTQAELGDFCGISNSTVSGWEKSKRPPSYEKVNILCQVLGIPNDVLLSAVGYQLSIGAAGKLPRQLLLDLAACTPDVLVAIQRLAEIGAAAARREQQS